MKITKPITLWDKMKQAIENLTDEEDIDKMNDNQLVDKIIELAYHYRIEYNRLLQEREEDTWM
jgi:hypothetical protein